MKKLLLSLSAALTSLFLAHASNAATVQLVASDSELYLSEADLDNNLANGLEGVAVGITGLVDFAENAPGASPVGTAMNWSLLFDPATNTVVSGAFEVAGYLVGTIILGEGSAPATPPSPVLTVLAQAHASPAFNAGLIDNDMSIGLAFPNVDVSGIGSIADAIAATPISVTSFLVFDISPAVVPLPASGGLLAAGLMGLIVARRRRRSG